MRDVGIYEGTRPTSSPINFNSTFFTVNVTLSAASAVPVSFHWQTQQAMDLGAASSDDYASMSSDFTFQPGETTGVIGPLAITADTYPELNEHFSLLMSNPVNAQLERTTAIITILDDDNLQPVSISDVQTAEGTPPYGEHSRIVTISGLPFTNVAIDWATSSGTATGGASCDVPGVDYVSEHGTITYVGSPIFLDICPDAVFEPDETLTITLTNRTPGLTMGRSTATVTIMNDDAPPPACTIRPAVRLQTNVLGPGRLQVFVRSSTSPGTPSNPLNGLVFDRLDNARVEVAGRAPSTQPFNLALPDHPTEASFVVNRVAPGPVMVYLRVQDACGEWPTFVGGGASGF